MDSLTQIEDTAHKFFEGPIKYLPRIIMSVFVLWKIMRRRRI